MWRSLAILLLMFGLLLSTVGTTAAQTDEELEAAYLELTTYLQKKEKDREKPEFSEKDKQRMQELAQLPIVRKLLQRMYASLQKRHQEEAYRLNVSNDRDGLYHHPVLQEYINDLGQSLVPENSLKLYTFRAIYDPRPSSFALSTGSVYVSTGMLSMMESEAQLAFVLGHEIAHIERDHFFEKIRGQLVEHALYIEKKRASESKSALWGAIGAGAGAAVGAGTGGWGSAASLAAVGFGGGYAAASLFNRVRPHATAWDEVREGDADKFGLRVAASQGYDISSADELLITLQQTVNQDPRAGLAFNDAERNFEHRRSQLRQLLRGELAGAGSQGSDELSKVTSGNFNLLMASVKRDNGIRALEYDLFEVAQNNLEAAVEIRSDDALAQYHLGKVYRLTARDDATKARSQEHFSTAIQFDEQRSLFPEPHLQLALSMIREGDPELYPRIQQELKTFVRLYQRSNGGALPRNMPFIYDYLTMTGELEWNAPPVTNTISMPEGSSGTGSKSQSN